MQLLCFRMEVHVFLFALETNMEEKKEDSAAAAAATTPTTADDPNAMPVPKIKHDWYQTEAFVIVTVLVKNLKKEDVKIDFTEKTVSIRDFVQPLQSSPFSTLLQLLFCHLHLLSFDSHWYLQIIVNLTSYLLYDPIHLLL